MKIKFYILISLFIVSCGGGGGMGGSSSDNNGGTGMPSDPMINTFSSTVSSV